MPTVKAQGHSAAIRTHLQHLSVSRHLGRFPYWSLGSSLGASGFLGLPTEAACNEELGSRFARRKAIALVTLTALSTWRGADAAKFRSGPARPGALSGASELPEWS